MLEKKGLTTFSEMLLSCLCRTAICSPCPPAWLAIACAKASLSGLLMGLTNIVVLGVAAGGLADGMNNPAFCS